jgi:hypothetical protein
MLILWISHVSGPSVSRRPCLGVRINWTGENAQVEEEEVMGFLSDEDREKLTPSELLPNETPIPTQVVSSDEYYPYPQTEK